MPDPGLAGRVAAARVARLATIDPDGRPHVVPMCFALSGGVLYSAVDRKPKRSRDLRRLRNVRERGWATVLVDHYEEDWSALWWVRLRGRARVLEDGAEASATPSRSSPRSTPSTGASRRRGRWSRWTSPSGGPGRARPRDG